MPRILVVDDHDMVRSGLVNQLRACPGFEVVGEAADGRSGVELALRQRPDVVLMDVRMPQMDGLAAIRAIRRHWDQARIIAVTGCDEEASARQLLAAGAVGIVAKSADIATLRTAIRHACQGQRFFSDKALAQRLVGSPRRRGDGPFDGLTGRELEIARHVVSGRKPKDIARMMYITSQTVHTYRYRIFDKLGIHSDVELTHLALQHGLVKDAFG